MINGSTPRGRQYAEEEVEKWTRHRETITTLFITEKKTLQDVMTIMKEKYNFKATARMYKTRFKVWGITKNVTASDVEKLLNRLEKHNKGGLCTGDACEMHELDIGKDIDVKRIQAYMKRNPVGLKKFRDDPKRPLDLIKALTVNTGKGRSGRGKVTIPAVKLEHHADQHQVQMTSPSSDLGMPWSPSEAKIFNEGLSDEMARLLQTVVDQEFNMPYTLGDSPLSISSTPSSPWQSMHPSHSQLMATPISPSVDHFQTADQLMLDFVLKFRIAHLLLEDGFTVQAFEVVNMCMNILSTRLQQTRGSDTRASGTVMLYALTAALEMATCFNRLDILHMLFQHISVVCAGQQPRMAEIAQRMPQLDRVQQISTLKLARMMMSRAAVGYSGREDPGYGLYSRTVDIAISQEGPDEKLRRLQACQVDQTVQNMPYMAVWMEERIALGVCDAPLASHPQGIWNAHTHISGGFPLMSQGGKVISMMKYSSERMDWHKINGNWTIAQRWACDLSWLAEIVHGYDDELTRKFRADMGSVGSPMLSQSTQSDVESDVEVTPVGITSPMGVALAPMHTSHAAMSLPEIRGFRDEVQQQPVSSPTWDQHAHGQFPDTTLPSLWNAMGGVMEGMNTLGLYGNAASF